jgi:hypothetical protein
VIARIEVDWQAETATAEYGGGVYALVCHRYGDTRPVYEYTTPTGAVVRVGGFRKGVRELFDRMMRECET